VAVNENDKTNEGDGDRVDDKPEAVAHAVRHVVVRNGVEHHEDVWGSHKEKRGTWL